MANFLNVANVKDSGATGNGITDDTADIQAAIDSLGATGGTVYFPVGDYVTSAALTVSSYIELLGESRMARILATTPDAAIKVADTQVFNSNISVRCLEIRGSNTTPIGIDARYMIGSMIEDCEVTQFAQSCISFGGNTTEGVNAAWSNTVIDSLIRNSPACIYLNGVHSSGGSPANWITIERCQVSPRDTIDSIGIDLVNGGEVRIINNDISYAPNATAIMLRNHTRAEIHANRFEDIGQVPPSFPIEKEYEWALMHFTGSDATIYYQRAEYVQFTGAPTGGTFTLTRGAATTGPIAFSSTPATLATNIRVALEGLAGVGAGNVRVTDAGAPRMRIAWLNGRGRSNRPTMTANGSGLTGGTTPAVSVAQGTHADAIQYSDDIALGGVINDTEMPSVNALGRHLDVTVPLVMRQPMLSVLAPGTPGVQLQRDTEDYPRLLLTVNGHFLWANPDTGDFVGGLTLQGYDPDNSKVAWNDNMSVALSRRTTVFGESAVTSYYRGSLYRHEGSTGVRDQLRLGMKDKDNQTYVRHLYPGFTVNQSLDFPSIAAGAVGSLTMTATGADVGDMVVVTPPATLAPGLMVSGFVSSANTVTIRVMNGSAAAVNPAAATWTVLVLQP